MFKQIILIILCLLLSLEASSTTIYLMRHAEKLSGKDPELTKIGKQRAQQLATLLKKVNITHIFSTGYKRTFQTAQPLATKLGKEIVFYDPRQLKEFAEKLQGLNGNILVIGHSNTTPELTHLLSKQPIKPLTEMDYGDLYQVILLGDKTNLQHLMVSFDR
jgi:phosphohistidine phosphatase SixA